MRPSRLLVRLPATLSPLSGRAVAFAIALLLLAPMTALAAPSAPVPREGRTAPPAAPAPPGTTSLVSQRLAGGFANAGSTDPSISANGRYVAFTSAATNLVATTATATLPNPAVFVRDRKTSTTVIVPLPGGSSGGGSSSEPSISADGNVVAFTYQPPTTTLAVVVGPIVLAWDRRTGTTEIVSRSVSGTSAGPSSAPSVSGDGRYVAFTSQSDSIVRADGRPNPDVYRYDRSTGSTVLVSVGLDGLSASGSSTAPSISDDGNLVAFTSDAGPSLVTAVPGKGAQVYVRDIAAGRTESVSGAPGGAANGEAGGPSISANGRYVAFQSAASNLVAGDDGRFADVFRRDRQAGTTVMVSVTPAGAPGGNTSGQASISRSGRMVAFASAATDLVDATTGLGSTRLAALATGTSEVYERDVDAGETILVSVAIGGGEGGGRSLLPAVAGNGRYVAFASTSPNLVDGDSGTTADVFLRDLPPAPVLNPPVLDLGARAVGTVALPAAVLYTNLGWSPVTVGKATISGPAAGDFSVVADGCDGRTLRRSEACTISVDFAPSAKGSRSATLEVPDDFTGSPRTTALTGAGSKAALTLDPAIGPPGIVVVVHGGGFPAGSSVRLRWSAGITPTLAPIVADASGSFEVQVLVFHSDVTGPRDLVAEPVDGTAFPPVSGRMLVTMPSVTPPGFLLRRFIDLPLMLVIRG